jgi:hypothetical protein
MERRNRFFLKERRPHANQSLKKRGKIHWGETTSFDRLIRIRCVQRAAAKATRSSRKPPLFFRALAAAPRRSRLPSRRLPRLLACGAALARRSPRSRALARRLPRLLARGAALARRLQRSRVLVCWLPRLLHARRPCIHGDHELTPSGQEVDDGLEREGKKCSIN